MIQLIVTRIYSYIVETQETVVVCLCHGECSQILIVSKIGCVWEILQSFCLRVLTVRLLNEFIRAKSEPICVENIVLVADRLGDVERGYYAWDHIQYKPSACLNGRLATLVIGLIECTFNCNVVSAEEVRAQSLADAKLFEAQIVRNKRIWQISDR